MDYKLRITNKGKGKYYINKKLTQDMLKSLFLDIDADDIKILDSETVERLKATIKSMQEEIEQLNYDIDDNSDLVVRIGDLEDENICLENKIWRKDLEIERLREEK